MARNTLSLDLPLRSRPRGSHITRWLYEEMRGAILEARLRPGTRLPATRDIARQYEVSRGVVVAVFEQLCAEGYVRSQVGAGTWVNAALGTGLARARNGSGLRSAAAAPASPEAARPFRPTQPAIDQFPADVWAKVTSRRLRRAPRILFGDGDPRGYAPLREAIADYLGASRGVRCGAENVVVVSGTQQALDLVARVALAPADTVWMEDPGYGGAVAAFRNAGLKIAPVPVDGAGLDVAAGKRNHPRARGVYITPAHQFPLGAVMPAERRLALLDWARRSGALIIEDDYDSEYRFAGQPIPALQGLGPAEQVVFLGSFNKMLFPSLRVGYLVASIELVEKLARFRFQADRYPAVLPQAVLCDFIAEGHLGRHLRRVREVYRVRLEALRESAARYAAGLLEVAAVPAGLHTPAFLKVPLSSEEAEAAARSRKVETLGLHRYALQRPDPGGLLLGFGGFEPPRLREAMASLARALESSLRSR